MKLFAFGWLLLGFVFWAGCSAPKNALESGEHILYYDRNGDGKVDLEVHRYPRWADADWELRDDDFDGRYEKKILYGVGAVESAVDLPVPTGVHIQPNR
jgi:hypothetical protein